MRIGALTLRLVALAIGVSVVSACGGSGNGSGSVPRSSAQAAAQKASGSSGDLLYVSMNDRSWILTYPGLSKVAEISGYDANITAADPNNGNVIVGEAEFAHGGTAPFAYLQLQSGQSPHGVAFDPTTDNVAYAVDEDAGTGGWIAVYRNLNSPPNLYTDPDMSYYGNIVYDAQGNLFVLGTDSAGHALFAELPKGANQFTDVTPNEKLAQPYDLLWDGQYVVIRNGAVLLRVTLSGATLDVVGKTKLKDAYAAATEKFWIQGDDVIGTRAGTERHRGRYVALWRYPQGGAVDELVKWVSKDRQERFDGAAVSVATSPK